MNISETINTRVRLYNIGTDSESAELPLALPVLSGEWRELDCMANPQRQTWFVITPSGFYGVGPTITAAAVNCHKAGARKSDRAVAQVVIGDDAARFVSIFNIESKLGSTLLFVGAFPTLGALVNAKQPDQKGCPAPSDRPVAVQANGGAK